MAEIGGYFGLETCLGGEESWHSGPCFNSGRGVLQWLLQYLDPAHAWLPLYSCEVLYHPFQQLDIPYTLYRVNEQLVPVDIPEPSEGELLLYINYNDGCRETATQLAETWKHQCIIDNTQAFFWKPGLPAWSFNSARKWMGVADGAYVMAPTGHAMPGTEGLNANTCYCTDHLYLRQLGDTAAGYPFFQKNERLCGEGTALVSSLRETILRQADYECMVSRRRQYFHLLHEALGKYNQLPVQTKAGTVPMYYPFLPSQPMVHEYFWQQQIYVPRLWLELASIQTAESLEKKMATHLLPLPIDHRYTTADMSVIIRACLAQLS